MYYIYDIKSNQQLIDTSDKRFVYLKQVVKCSIFGSCVW